MLNKKLWLQYFTTEIQSIFNPCIVRLLKICVFYMLQLVVSGAETNTNSYDRQRSILTCKGPFVSTRLAQKNFSGNARPSVAILNTTMENLATDGLGEVNVVDRSTVFYKKLPADVNEETLAGYEVEREAYLRAFNERADKAVISKHLFNKFLEQSAHKVRLREEHDITSEEA